MPHCLMSSLLRLFEGSLVNHDKLLSVGRISSAPFGDDFRREDL